MNIKIEYCQEESAAPRGREGRAMGGVGFRKIIELCTRSP